MSLFKRHFAATFVGFLTALDTRADSKEGSVQASSCQVIDGFQHDEGHESAPAAATRRTAQAAVHLIQNRTRKTMSWNLTHVCSEVGIWGVAQ